MKRFVSLFMMLIFAVGIFSACKKENISTSDTDKIDVICTVAPVFDWVLEVVGDLSQNFEVTLLSNGTDIHGFQPSARDIADIQNCDILITVGGASDIWIDNNIEGLDKVSKVRLFDLLPKDELLTSSGDHHHTEHEVDEYDEHIWLSLKYAQMQVNGICDALCEADPQNGIIYKKNAADYCDKLRELDKNYMKVAENSRDKTVIFADRFPFAYMMRDYNLTCYSAFSSCSTDTDASFEVVIDLAKKVEDCNKDTLIVLENSDRAVAQAISDAAVGKDREFVVMDSCQSVSSKDVAEFDYAETMIKNLDTLEAALK
ncbi:MAG: zinc ABC transporter substrate-binding protein [Clostridia bacterium]|nr:zinc ABC transporter substrate-binding protein [Clostridia bacterium]